MSRHRGFADGAGYTRHCWECTHATDWRKRLDVVDMADCELTGRRVLKYDSPNNQCCHVGIECRYETKEGA